MSLFELNLPETIKISPQVAWVVIHVLFAFGVHDLWVYRTRQAMRMLARPSFCQKCMWRQLIPLSLWGLELKVVQLVLFAFLWLANLALGAGVAKPFDIRLYKNPAMSFRPACNHK